MHAFVLHLTRARGRRDNALRLLDMCGLPGEIWAAVDGKALSEADLTSEVQEQIFEPNYPFVLNSGEIGCFMSHRQIWAEILHRGLDYALIVEDDVQLEPDLFDDAVVVAERHIDEFGYIQLQNMPPKGALRLIDQQGAAMLTVPDITPLRTSAQLVSAAGAARLLDHAHRFDRPIDTFVQSHWYTGLQAGVVYPSGVSTISNQLEGSTIQKGRKSVAEKLRREIGRSLYRRKVAAFSKRDGAGFDDDV